MTEKNIKLLLRSLSRDLTYQDTPLIKEALLFWEDFLPCFKLEMERLAQDDDL